MLKTLIVSVCLFIFCDAVGILKSSTCPAIKLKFGRARYRQKGRFAKFMCNTGYLIAGEKYSTCVNGTWDGPMPKCVRATCKKVNPPVNGLIYPSHRGAVLNFFCKPGLDLRGPPTIYCDGRNWDNNLPSCIVTNTKPTLECNFEKDDLCGWNHDLRHDFDWTRMNFKTPSGHLGTGPSFDHTLGEGKDGYYMYIESSSRHINDTARLISPIYDKTMDNTCFEFFYHMHGASTGQLRVYLKRLSDSWALIPENAIFWKIGNHGDIWLHSFIHLGPITEDFQIIIEGVRGNSFYSDIAIDDVRIITNCTINEISTESDVVYTEDYSPIQSCVNRCDNDTAITNSPLISCGCDDTCTDNSTCCLDYIAVCVEGVTDDSYTTTEFTVGISDTSLDKSSTEVASITISNSPKSTLLYLSSLKSETVLNGTRTSTVRTRRSTIDGATTVNTTYSPINTTAAALTTTTEQSKISVNLPTESPKQPYAPTKRSRTSSTTPNLPNSPIVVEGPTRPQRSRTPSTTSNPPDSPIVLEGPTRPQKPRPAEKPTSLPKIPVLLPTGLPIIPKLPNFTKYVARQSNISPNSIFDEVITVPVKAAYKDNDDIIPAKPVVHSDKENFDTSNVQNQKIIREESQTSTTIVVVAVVSVSIILIVVLGAALVKRYKYNSCNRSRIHGSGSDSQSDVRFLTSDEILDFNVAYPDD